MLRLSFLLALTFFVSALVFGQTSPAWSRIHADSFNDSLGIADGANSFGQWKYTTSGPITSSAAIDKNWNVYFGTSDGHLIALDEHGKFRWSFAAGGEVFSPAIGPDGNIYVGSADGNLYDLDSGSGTLVWKFAAKGPVRTTPIFDPTTQNIAFGSDDHYCYGLTHGGTLAWKFQTGSTVTFSPVFTGSSAVFAADDNTLYFLSMSNGTAVGTYINNAGWGGAPSVDPNHGTLYVGGLDSTLYAFNGTSLAWTNSFTGAIRTTPAIGPDGTVYFGTDAGVLYAYNHANPQNLQQNWAFVQPGGPIRSSPALGDGGNVYFGCDDGHLYAAAAGNLVWQAFTDGSLVRSSPAINFDGTIMVGSEDGVFYAVGTQSPVPIASVTATPSSIVGGNTIVGTVTLNGAAPAGGDVVNLHVVNEPKGTPPAIPPPCSFVPAFVMVPQFQASAQFAITTIGVDDPVYVDLYAVSGYREVSSTFVVTVPPVTSLTITPASVVGGNAAVGNVTVGSPASQSGEQIYLSSNNASILVPKTTFISGGDSSVQFPVGTLGVDSTTTGTVAASAGGASFSASLKVLPANLVSITLNPTSVVGGVANSIASINLDGLPGPSGILVTLTSSNPDVASVPDSLLVIWDNVNKVLVNTFVVTTTGVTTNVDVTISGTYNQVTKKGVLTVTPPQLVSVTLNPNSVLGGQNTTGTVTLSSVTPKGGIPVSLATTGPDLSVQNSVLVPEGATTATFSVTTTGVPAIRTEGVTANWDNVTMTANLTINPPVVQGLTITPTVVVGGSNVKVIGTVTLSGNSGTPGDDIQLSSSDITVATVPSTMTISGGQNSGTFVVNTLPVIAAQRVTITATFNNTSQKFTLTINPVIVNGFLTTPTTIGGGSPVTGKVVVSAVAGPNGFLVKVSSASPDAIPPSTVAIPAGSASALFQINTRGVSKQESVLLTAGYGTSGSTCTLVLTPSSLATLTIAPSSVVGGNNATGTLNLAGTAPSGGYVVSLSSSSGSAVVPKSVTIPSFASSASFTIQTKGVAAETTATITAKLAKVSTSAKLSIHPAPLQSVSVSPSTVIGGSGTAVTGTVTLAGFGANTVVSLSSSNKSVVTLPASVKVASGKSSATFVVTHLAVTTSQTVTITATSDGVSKTATLTVNPFQVVSMSISPTSVVGGTSATGVVGLNAPAGAKAISVKLSSSTSAAIVPATVSVGAKSSTGKFTIKTVGVATTTAAQITGSIGATSASGTLTINPPSLKSLTVSPASVKGSASTKVTGTVTITSAAPPSGLTIHLASSSSAAGVPATVVIASGKTSGTFTVTHQKVTSATSSTITVTLNGSSKTATLTITAG